MKCSERRQGNTTQQKDKATQHNTTRPRQLFSKKKTASSGIRTHDRALARRTLLPTELPRQLSWLDSNHIYNTKQPKHLNQSITNQTHAHVYMYMMKLVVLCPLPGDGEEDDSSDVQSQGKQEDGEYMYYDSTPVTHMTPGVKEFVERLSLKVFKRKRGVAYVRNTPTLTH